MSITKLNNFTEKSFRNYTGPDRNFKQKNIIFGYNGRGKSSLAKGIIREYLKDTSNSPNNYRFFDRNYINNNLLLKESINSRIKGVIANFGQKDIDIEKEIDALENTLIDTKQLENEIIELNKKTRTEIDKIHDNKKGKIIIQKKPTSKTNKEVIELYNEDIEKAKKIEKNEEELLKIKGDNSLEKQKLIIESINIPIIQLVSNEEIDTLKYIFAKKFDDIQIPNSKIIEWISNGLHIHQDGEKCKFCGGTPDLVYIKEKIEKYNSNEKQKASIQLTQFRDKIESLIAQLNNLLLAKDNIYTNISNNTMPYFTTIEKSINILSTFKETINNKIDNIQSNIELDCEKLNEIINDIKISYDNIALEKRKQISFLDEKILKLNILIKGAIGIEIKNSTLITDNMKLAVEKEKTLKEAKKKNEENLKKIDDLKKSKSNTKDFADHISKILSMLEINLKLEVLNDDYIIKHSITDDILKIEDISEGEQNLLSLLYFYYELFEDSEQTTLKPIIKLIVIDDPISSVDDINKMYVLELVKKICELNNIQLFIFTHVWDDFCNICYNKHDKADTPFGFFEIKKDDTGSTIMDAKTNETPYKHNFKEIHEFSLKANCSNMSDCEIYHYPNIMRKILEEFLEFKVKNSSPTYANINNIKLVLCGENPTNNDELAIGTLLNVCNILSHKASRNPDEILKAAKFLMRKIEKVDKLHFDTMKS